MIDVETAGRLLDFGARMGQGPRADEQLQGAVALHNILARHNVAYLADEVGMGKTYVALGAVALFRHFQPDFRVVVIAPRENIQQKWMKELRNFAAYNVKYPDFRNRSIDRQPGRPLVSCDNLLHFVHEAVVDARRDFFVRLSSFSFGLTDDGDRSGWRKQRDKLLEAVPWLDKAVLTINVKKEEFKDNFARAVCCALPAFDLVIVDEGHNLKHGFAANVAARNRVLALAFGHPSEAGKHRDFPTYGTRAKRVLFLSATPLEETYRHIWNQLDVFGKAAPFAELRQDGLDEGVKKATAAKFLVRRVTNIKIAGQVRTKNQYRREWRAGGVHSHDDPVTVSDPRHRLIVALIQKKVAELLNSEKFGMSFQIGMLASFESFLETTRLKRSDDDGEGNFDDAEQTEDQLEREGIDVRDINRLSRLYREQFNDEMPHPKMDALVGSLKNSWEQGRKALVFVRRVASVKDLKRKLDKCYDECLIPDLRARLPEEAHERFDQVVAQYRTEKQSVEAARRARLDAQAAPTDSDEFLDDDDRGGTDTFFAWYFRGQGPKGIVSGANVKDRFTQKGTIFGTFFDDNYVAALLGAEPGSVTVTLERHLGLSRRELAKAIQIRAAKYLSGKAVRLTRGYRVEAFQAAAVELLSERSNSVAADAASVWRERFEGSRQSPAAKVAPALKDELELETFFTELRRPEWESLRSTLWPASQQSTGRDRFREEQLRAQLLATAARLGHALIDLYVMTIARLGSLELRTLDREAGDETKPDSAAIRDYLAILDHQRVTPLANRPWGAFDELAEISSHFELILDVNAPDARTTPLAETARLFGSQLRQQQPVAGMSGQVNRTVVQQFRMPGYPFVLISTDLLQEGEDLHTFCSSVYHYGISWTPSAMEQRIGRIDRVRSQTDRRLNGLYREASGAELLQVFYPYLSDTVEVLQVNRVLERMNTFLRLMHEGLSVPKADLRTIDVASELVSGRRAVEAVTTTLETAFPVPDWALQSIAKGVVVDEGAAALALGRFHLLRSAEFGLPVVWEADSADGRLLGTVTLPSGRVQPFTLLLKSDGERMVVRCVSPIGRVGVADQVDGVREAAAECGARIGVILTEDAQQYDVTAEGDVPLAAPEHDASRVALLIRRVTNSADSVERHRFRSLDHLMPSFETDLRREGVDGNS